MKQHRKLKISGKVQGVYYRASMQQKARTLGVDGWVQNLPNGQVYAEIEGELTTLQAMIEWCKQGPAFAAVEQVEIAEGMVQHFSGFEIKRSTD